MRGTLDESTALKPGVCALRDDRRQPAFDPLNSQLSFQRLAQLEFLGNPPSESCRVPGHNCAGGYILRHHAACANDRAFADGDPAEQCRPGTDGSAPFHECGNALPVGLGLQVSATVRGAWIKVVSEHDAVADENFVFENDTFTNESVAGYFAAAANFGTFLHFHEGADFGFVANFAAVEVYEAKDANVPAQFHAGSDELKRLMLGAHD